MSSAVPVGLSPVDDIQSVCDTGCGMPLLRRDATGVDTHGRLTDMRRRVTRYETRIIYLETVLRWLTAEYGRRCSALLARIASLTSHCDKCDGQQHVGAIMILLFISQHACTFYFSSCLRCSLTSKGS